MDIKKITIDAKLIITIQSEEKEITETMIGKAKLMTEININVGSGFCILDDGTKCLYRCHIEE